MRVTHSLRQLFVVGLASASLLASAAARADDTPAAAAAPTPAPAMIRVHLESRAPVRIQRRGLNTNRWTAACTSPCDVDLPASDDYRFLGADGTAGDVFRLPLDAGAALTLTAPEVIKASVVRTKGAMGLVVGGGSLALTGTVGVVAGIAVARASCTPGPDADVDNCDNFRGGPGVGVPVIIVSSVLLLGGVAMIVVGASIWTPRKEPKPTDGNTAFVREPTWTVPEPRVTVEVTVRGPARGVLLSATTA